MKKKAVLSVILSVLMLLPIIAVPASADEVKSVTVHYFNENNWANPYIYYYSGNNQGREWPGEAMTAEGDGWYTLKIYGYSRINVIFSDNGKNQYPAPNEDGIEILNEMWYYKGELSSAKPEAITNVIHYYNENNWQTPYVYYYSDSKKPVSWPGVPMNSEGGNWYSYTVSDISAPKIIFSDNGKNQYPAKDEPGLTFSGEKWYLNGTFYDSEPEGITVHYQNYDFWDKVNIYYYNGDRTSADWTGNPMTADGDGWYTYKIYGFESVKVLFNNGGNIQIPGRLEPGFDVSGEMWYRNGEWTTERPDDITVYFYKPNGWGTPNIYYYKSDSDKGRAWPGEQMKPVGDNWYSFTITKYASAKVMFNSGANQIPAKNQPGFDVTGIMRYKDGVWYDDNDDNLNDDIIDFGDIETLLSNGKIEVIFDGNGGINVINGKFTDKKITSKESAAEVLNSASSLFGNGFSASATDITVQTINNGESSQKSFYRYTPTINGVSVLGSQIIISTDSSGNAVELFNSYVNTVNNVNSSASISAAEAENAAITQIILREDINQFISSFVNDDISMDIAVEAFKNSIDVTSDLLIYAVDKYQLPVLVYAVNVSCDLSDGENNVNLLLDLTYHIYANGENAGDIYMVINNVQGAAPVSVSAEDLLGNERNIECEEEGGKYYLRDTTRNIETYKTTSSKLLFFWKIYNLPGEIADSTSRTAVSAHANFSEVYDYYKNVLGRDSFDDSGASFTVSYDHGGVGKNAEWKPFKSQFIIGNEGNLAAALDVVGHEFTHAVISKVVNVGYYRRGLINGGEPGALCESYCDILGSIIEGKTDDGFWLLGEDSDQVLRSLSQPSSYNQPENYDNYDHEKGVHYNCGIFNYAAYKMMTDNRTGSISNETWAQVFYQSLYRLTDTAKFIDARGAILCAAKDLGFNGEQQQAIKDSFDSVKITEPDSIRIELTWGAKPSDLDSHLVGPSPDGSGRFHVYYGNKTCYKPGDNNRQLYAAELDYDDTTSYGPEVTTIHALTPGVYYFYVHDFSNGISSVSKAMANSNAKVKVYKGASSTPINTFNVDSNSSGTYWNVFKLTINESGEFGIESINTYASQYVYE